ncbi:MAG: carboxypeptidase regulatory-like domain-containing protein [Acidimicrobiia bacterium]
MLTPEVRVFPGVPAELRFEVANTGDVVDSVALDMPRVNKAWLSKPEEHLALFPAATGELSVLLTVPESHPAGRYRLLAEIRSLANADDVEQHLVDVVVAGTVTAELHLRPMMVTGGRRAHLTATVVNGGNAEVDLTLSAEDPARALEFVLEPHYLSLGPGERANVAIETVGRRPLFGTPISHAVTVKAEGAGQELAAAATVVQKPWIPRGVATLAILAAIIAGWAVIFKVGVGQVTKPDAFGKQAPKALLIGETDLDPSLIAGSLTGVVQTQSTGTGLARVTVEAHRVLSTGPEIASSVATKDDGSFELAGLLPGRYLLRFSAPGFSPLWYPGTADQAAAEQVRIEAEAAAGPLAMTLAGDPGRLSGVVAVGQVAGQAPEVTVRIRRRDGDTLGPLLTETKTDAAGVFEFPDLETPAAYQLTFAATGYADLSLEESLAGGQDLVVNTVALEAAPGTLAGLVTSAAGAPLGGVTVTATRGDTVVETVTPTAGQVGAFQLIGLETPGTYVVTFRLDGYGTQTLALDLGPGENRANVNVTLTDGTGTVSGTVLDAGGRPLGGVTVTATSGEFSLSTQTLTGGAVGTFSLAGLRAPATYTVTFALDGFGSESRRLQLDTSQVVTAFDVTMSPSVGAVEGVVRRSGTDVGGATVSVSDGTTKRVTASASSPAGAYRVGNLPPGAYTVTVELPGRATQTVLVNVVAGQAATVDVDLVS